MKCLIRIIILLIISIQFMDVSYASGTNTNNINPRIRIWTNNGKHDVDLMMETIAAVWKHMDYTPSKNFQRLIIETMAVETGIGEEDVHISARRYKNYGLCQFRLDSAKFVLNTIKKQAPKRYNSIMVLYSKKWSLKENLMYNVPFSIALCKEYYTQRKATKNINNVYDRAITWCKYYNCSIGTVKVYISRVNTHLKTKRG